MPIRLFNTLRISHFSRTPAAAILLAFLGLSCGGKDGDPAPPVVPGTSTATVVGITLGTNGGGLPLAGVQLSASPTTGATATSNSFGTFTLTVPANTPVAVTAAHAGFADHPFTVELAAGETRAVTLVLPAFGATASLAAATGGTVTDAGAASRATVPPGFVSGTSFATVSVTGLDPTTEQALAMPGTFAAENALGSAVSLAPAALVELRVGDGAGTTFPLLQPVVLDLHLPASLQSDKQFFLGAPIPCWRFDPASGRWKFYANGSVATSPVDGQKAVRLSVTESGWFAAGFTNGSNGCVSGVVFSGVNPVAGATVQAYPGGSDVTKADGSYRVNAPPGLASVQILATRPITGGVQIASGTSSVGLAGGTCINKILTLQGSGPPPTFSIAGQLMRGRDQLGVPRDQAFVTLRVNGSLPLEGANIELGDGIQLWTLPHIDNGIYGIPGGLSFLVGATYTLRVDFEPDGTFDATSQIVMPGKPEITSPAEDELTEPSFTASWTDPAAAIGGYSARYIGDMESQTLGSHPARFVALSPTNSIAIGTGVGQPQYSMTNDPLPAGPYVFRLWATNGPVRYPIGGGQTIFDTPNIVVGTNITGYFSAIAQADSIDFASLGEGTRPARQVARRR